MYDLQWFHMNILNTPEYLFQGINSGQIQVSGPTPTCWADWAPGGNFWRKKRIPSSKTFKVFVFDRMSKGNVEDARARCSSTRSFRVFMRELDLRWTDRFDHFYWDELWVFPKIKSTTKWMTSNLQIVVGPVIILWQLQDKITSLQPSSIFFWSTKSHGNHNVDIWS